MKTNQISNNKITFNGFYKIKGSEKEIKNLKQAVNHSDKDILVITTKRGEHKNTALVLTGKTFDKFMDIVGTIYFRELRENLHEYLNKKPKTISLDSITAKIKKDNK